MLASFAVPGCPQNEIFELMVRMYQEDHWMNKRAYNPFGIGGYILGLYSQNTSTLQNSYKNILVSLGSLWVICFTKKTRVFFFGKRS